MKSEIKKKKKEEGFTLFELLLVITIIMGIMSILFSMFGKNEGKNTAKALALLEEGRQLAQAVQMYKVQYDAWPANATALVNKKILSAEPEGWINIWSTYAHGMPMADITGSGTTDAVMENDNVKKDICEIIKGMSQYKKFYRVHSGGNGGSFDNCVTGNNQLFYLVERDPF